MTQKQARENEQPGFYRSVTYTGRRKIRGKILRYRSWRVLNAKLSVGEWSEMAGQGESDGSLAEKR